MNIRGIVGNGENAKPKGEFSFRVILARLNMFNELKVSFIGFLNNNRCKSHHNVSQNARFAKKVLVVLFSSPCTFQLP